MNNCSKNIFRSIVTIILVTMFFSCSNTSKEIKELFSTKNLPVGIAKNIHHVYKDSGNVTSKLIAPVLKDFSNREEHPYNEFPKGIKIVSLKNNSIDSVTITGNYGITYLKTRISELKGAVVIVNHKDKSILETEQLFLDETTNYVFSEKKFTLTTPSEVSIGIGFESKKDLSKFLAKKFTGEVLTKE